MIRPAERRDLPAVVAAWEALMATGQAADPRFRASENATGPMRAMLEERWFGRFHPFPPAWVAIETSLAGWISCGLLPEVRVVSGSPTVRIDNLWVEPALRRRGLGRMLVEALVGSAHGAGFRGIEVGTLTRDTRARAFWEALGFTEWKVLLLRDDP